MSTDLKPLIAAAVDRPLTEDEARAAFDLLFDGEATPSQIGGFLMTLRVRGESVSEYAAAAAAMRARARKVRAPAGAIDIVGTGGDGKGTLNISTAAAFVVAGAGVPVAKHGNRNLSSKSGAADVIAAQGIETMVGPEVVERALAEVGIGFMMAPMHHPAIANVMPTRVELGTRTIFNILGPLTNPAGVTRQLSGAFSTEVLAPMAETLGRLGSERAWLVHGGDGTDELSISAPSTVAVLEEGRVTMREVAPEEAGLPRPSVRGDRRRQPRGQRARLPRAPRRGALGLSRRGTLERGGGAGGGRRRGEPGRGGGARCREHRQRRGARQGRGPGPDPAAQGRPLSRFEYSPRIRARPRLSGKQFQRRASIAWIAAATAASMSSAVVSITAASGAGFRGASARSMSRASRARTSARTAS